MTFSVTKKTKSLSLTLSVIVSAFVAAPVSAAVVGGAITGGTALTEGGVFVNLSGTAPFTIGNDNFQDYNLYAFDEDQNITIGAEIDVNIGTNPQVGDIVASHYVAYDSPTSGTRNQIGYIDFDAPIYGVATETAFLAASDFLANSNVTYLNPTLRGLEAGDSVAIDITDPNRLLINWASGTPGDYVRVFTMKSPLATIPIPATGLLLLGSFGALAGLNRRRKT